LLERVNSEQGSGQGPELVRVTQAGLVYLAGALAGNRQARSAHEALVGQVAQAMLRDGRIVWTALELRARLPPDSPDASSHWKICKPDVFSIRNSSRPDYLEPIVHEIKVSRADLLGDWWWSAGFWPAFATASSSAWGNSIRPSPCYWSI
jgi:hypothetical protein